MYVLSGANGVYSHLLSFSAHLQASPGCFQHCMCLSVPNIHSPPHSQVWSLTHLVNWGTRRKPWRKTCSVWLALCHLWQLDCVHHFIIYLSLCFSSLLPPSCPPSSLPSLLSPSLPPSLVTHADTLLHLWSAEWETGGNSSWLWPVHHEGTPHGTLHVRGGEGMRGPYYMWGVGRGWEGHTTCEGWGGDRRSDQYSACTPSLVSPVSCRFFSMHLIKKPETEFTGQVWAVLASWKGDERCLMYLTMFGCFKFVHGGVRSSRTAVERVCSTFVCM